MGVYRERMGVHIIFDRNNYQQYRRTLVLDGLWRTFTAQKGVMEERVWKENPTVCRCSDPVFCDQIFLSVYSGRMGWSCGRIFLALLYTENFSPILVLV